MNPRLTVRITVRGRMSERLTAAFDGMTAVDRPHATQLVGGVVDQAQLHGLLARIRDLGLELESVSVAGPGDADESVGPSIRSVSPSRPRTGHRPDAP